MAGKAKSSRHFYYLENGKLTACHGIGIAEARAKLAFVSTTSVSKEVRATPFQLARWARKQLVKACQNYPKLAHEDDDAYYLRVDSASWELSDTAKDFGTALHDMVEHYPDLPDNHALLPWYDQYRAWHEANVAEVLSSEEIVADVQLGIAGRLDRKVILKDGRRAIVDIKTQGVKDRVYYGDDWIKQLSLYAHADMRMNNLPSIPTAFNLVVDSGKPAPITAKEWSRTELLDAYQEFTAEVWLWSTMNNHWPVGKWALAQVFG